MRLFWELVQWVAAIGEILLCYYFGGVLEDKELIRKNKVYVWGWSIGIGSMLAFNRSSQGLLSWSMLMLQSILIALSLNIKNKENKFLIFGIILLCNVCMAFTQLFVAFGILILYPWVDIEQVYLEVSMYRAVCYIVALLIMCTIYTIIKLNKKVNSASLKSFRWTFFFYGIAGFFLIMVFQHQLLIYGRSRSIENAFALIMIVGANVSTLLGSIKKVETQTALEMLEIKNKILEENYKEIQSMYQNYAYTCKFRSIGASIPKSAVQLF